MINYKINNYNLTVLMQYHYANSANRFIERFIYVNSIYNIDYNTRKLRVLFYHKYVESFTLLADNK